MMVNVGKPSTRQTPHGTLGKALRRENFGTRQHFKIRARPFWRMGRLQVDLQSSSSALLKVREML